MRDTRLDLNLRTYYSYSDNYDNTKNEAWALGGSLAYRSGWFLDRLKMGAALYTSQPLYAPDDRDGTLLLKPGQEGYTVVGQLYGKVKLGEQAIINIYRQQANSPYLNSNDSRMSPNTFEGYALTGAAGGKEGAPKINYGAGYVDKIKSRNSDRVHFDVRSCRRRGEPGGCCRGRQCCLPRVLDGRRRLLFGRHY
ncbi:MAG: OprD family porin [Chromatiales bacterium]|nr:OprD family porin [Chromatiales bacterium]